MQLKWKQKLKMFEQIVLLHPSLSNIIAHLICFSLSVCLFLTLAIHFSLFARPLFIISAQGKRVFSLSHYNDITGVNVFTIMNCASTEQHFVVVGVCECVAAET